MSTFSYYSKRFVRGVLTLLFVVLIVALSRNAWDLWRLADRVGETEGKLRQLGEEKERLEQEYEEKTSDFAIDKAIRDQLHLALPGETVVLVPDNGSQATSDKLRDENIQTILEEDDRPNWRKWWGVVRGEN